MAIELTRAQIETEYTVNENGIIQNPGKFEAEPVYAVYFYEYMMNGFESETIYDSETPVSVFEVDDDDRAEFPELADVHAVLLWTSETGFVNTREMTERQLESFRAECEQSEPDEPQEDDITTRDHQTFYQSGRVAFEVIEAAQVPSEPLPGYILLVKGVQKGGNVDRSGAGDAVYPTLSAAIHAYMELEQFWPSCWFISDHGNAHLMDLTEDK